MAHKLQLVRVLPFAEAGTVFTRVCSPDVVFRRLALRERAAPRVGTEAGTNASRHSDLAATATELCLP